MCLILLYKRNLLLDMAKVPKKNPAIKIFATLACFLNCD